MRDVSEIYTTEVHRHLRPLFGNWPLDRRIGLGDYGVMHGSAFDRLGNVTEFGLTFDVQHSPATTHYQFSSSEKTTVTMLGKGAAADGGDARLNPTLRIDFLSGEAAFLNAAGCKISSIGSKRVLGEEVLKLFREGSKKWTYGWCVVTDLVAAESTTIAVARAGRSSIMFETTAECDSIDLNNPALGLRLVSKTDVAFHAASERGLRPFFALGKLQQRFGILGLRFGSASVEAEDREVNVDDGEDDDLLFLPFGGGM